MFRCEYRNGDSCLISRVSNLASSLGTTIATGPANSSAITGWTNFDIYVSQSGYMALWINNNLACQVTDTTYALGTTGNQVRYFYEVVSGAKVAPAPIGTSGGSTFLNNTGAPAVGVNTFSYTSTTTSITWSWSAFRIYNSDGSTITVPSNGGTAFAGLTSSATYYFGFYVDVATGNCHVIKSDVSSGKAAESVLQIAQTLNGDGNVLINYNITAATPASGGGSGGGGGGDGGTCFSPNVRLADGTTIGSVRVGDLVWVEKDNGSRVLRPVAKVHIHEDNTEPMIDMGNGQLVTPRHHFRHEGGWAPAEDILFGRTGTCTTVWNLEIETEQEDERNYVLANGLCAHNFQKV